MKRFFCVFLAAVMAFSLNGCGQATVFTNYREVEDMELIRTVGVDTDGDGVTITAVSATGMTKGEPMFFRSGGPTLSQAINDMQRLPMGKEALFSHTEHIVISEKTAEKGIGEILDYIERSPDMRLETNLFIAKGEKTDALLTSVSGKDSDVSDLLSFVQENIPELGTGYVFSCRETASYLSDSGCALIQAVEAKGQEELYEGQPEKTLVPTVFAVIKDGKLTGFLTEEESLGAVLVLNRLKGKYVTVPTGDSEISLAVNGASSKVTAEMSKSGELEGIKIELELNANVTSVGGGALLSSDEVREKAEKELSAFAERSVTAAVSASRRMGADFMRIWKQVEMKHPEKFRKIPSWSAFFADVPVTVSAKSVIRRTFDIEDPVGTSGEGVKTVWGTMIK